MKLSGLRVLDLSMFLPGPYLSMHLADHGAEVIKIEAPGEGDPGRHIGKGQAGHKTFFRNLNRGKRSVVLNLKIEAGREALLRLTETADVFIEGFRPGVVRRLGVDYPVVAARNPRIVYASISGFGQTGPLAAVPAHDVATEAMGGLVSLNLGGDGQPTMPPVPVADLTASLLALSGVLMALYRRSQSGLGDYLDMSMHDAVLASVPNVLGDTFVDKRPPDRLRERPWGGNAFYRLYRTADGRHVVLGAAEIKFVRSLLGELGREDLVPLAQQGPGPHQAPIVAVLDAWFATRTQAEWVEHFRGRDLGFAPVRNLREAFDEPQAAARAMVLHDPDGIEHVGTPLKFRQEPGRVSFSVPAQGEHTDEVLAAAGYTAMEIAALRAAGALG
jgi:crotonobetainyl-CoA:carnitine CoA-transferase CaiB-like acyl-CoA transferase